MCLDNPGKLLHRNANTYILHSIITYSAYLQPYDPVARAITPTTKLHNLMIV